MDELRFHELPVPAALQRVAGGHPLGLRGVVPTAGEAVTPGAGVRALGAVASDDQPPVGTFVRVVEFWGGGIRSWSRKCQLVAARNRREPPRGPAAAPDLCSSLAITLGYYAHFMPEAGSVGCTAIDGLTGETGRRGCRSKLPGLSPELIGEVSSERTV